MENVKTVEEVFTGQLLRVPDYQRGYAWDRRQLDDFLEDLEVLPRLKEHYTGTLILHPRDGETQQDASGRSYAVVDVVDGQQRLTTITILLDSIRREMQSSPEREEFAEGIRKSYVAVTGLNGQPLHKLTLNEDTRDFWFRVVIADRPGILPPTIQSHRRLEAAKERFAQYLSDQRADKGEQYAEWLVELHNKVTQQLKVTIYTVSKAADVGVIFEVMNNRGKPLTELEKVKNYLLYVANKLDVPDHELDEAVNRSWQAIFQNLMRAGLTARDDEDQLLRMHWLMAYDYQKTNWERAKTIKDKFNLRTYDGRHVELLGDLLEYVQSLEGASQAFCEIVNPHHPLSFADVDPAVRDELVEITEKLRRTKQRGSFLPLLLGTRLRHTGEAKAYLEMVKLCERFAFRVHLLLRYRNSAGQSALFRVGNLLYNGKLELEDALREVRAVSLGYCSNSRFESAFELNSESNWYQWPGIKYLLFEYEEYLTGPRQTKLSWGDLEQRDKEKSIEHILPQTADDSYWLERFSGEEVELYTHDLGNLALTYDNSSYSNNPFPDKRGRPGLTRPDGSIKPCYANSVLIQERALTDFEDWSPAELTKRRETLVAWARERWHLEDATPIALDPDEEARDDGFDVAGEEGEDWDRATLTLEEQAISMVRPTRSNPYVIQPYNKVFYRPHHKGFSGQCEHCERPAAWSVKGTVRWFAICSPHAARWTGWENRAGAELVEIDESDFAPTETTTQARRAWDWDAYVAAGLPKDKVELSHSVVTRLKELWPDLIEDPISWCVNLKEPHGEIVFRMTISKTRPRLIAFVSETSQPDPFPQLKGKRGPESRWWWWSILKHEDIPDDLQRAIDLVRPHSHSETV